MLRLLGLASVLCGFLLIIIMDSESDCSDSWTDSRTLKFIKIFYQHVRRLFVESSLCKIGLQRPIRRQQAMRNIAAKLNVTGSDRYR